jgi:Aminopeptidase C
MNGELNIEDIKKYQEKLTDSFDDTIYQNVYNSGIIEASINDKEAVNYRNEFDIEIETCKMYNQKNSYQCSIYAAIRVIKNNLAENLDINVYKLDISANYIDFFDKLEKVNTFFNELIKSNTISFDLIKTLANKYITLNGTFHSFTQIIDKYGIVPETEMKDASDSFNAFELLELLLYKVKTDALDIKRAKESGENLFKLKDELLANTYEFLAKIYGTPPSTFDFEYINNKNRSISIKDTTPLNFKNNFMSLPLNDFVTVTSFPLKYFKNSSAYIDSLYLNNNEEIIESDIKNIKKAILKQLQNGTAVWFSTEESTTLDYSSGLLSDKIYNLKGYFEFKETSKFDALRLDIINYDHAMTITGLKLDKHGEIDYFKVDNSFGEHGTNKGIVIMPVKAFEKYTLTVILDKKYLK